VELQRGIRMTILGQSGSGKSTLARYFFLRYLVNNARDRYYVIDTYDTHFRGNDHVPGLARMGFIKVPINAQTLDSLGEGDYESKIESFDWDGAISKVGKAVFVIELPPDLASLAADMIARAILRAKSAVVLIDESIIFLSNMQRKISALGMLLTSGRPAGIDTIVISQHANFTNPILKDAATHIVTFRCTNDRELDMLVEKFPDRDSIRSLDYEKREFLMADTRGGCVRASMRDILSSDASPVALPART
jgi:hypothetical protein